MDCNRAAFHETAPMFPLGCITLQEFQPRAISSNRPSSPPPYFPKGAPGLGGGSSVLSPNSPQDAGKANFTWGRPLLVVPHCMRTNCPSAPHGAQYLAIGRTAGTVYCSSGRCGQHNFFSFVPVGDARQGGHSYESNMTGCLVCRCGAPNLDARMRKFKSRGKFFFTVSSKNRLGWWWTVRSRCSLDAGCSRMALSVMEHSRRRIACFSGPGIGVGTWTGRISREGLGAPWCARAHYGGCGNTNFRRRTPAIAIAIPEWRPPLGFFL